MERLDHYLGCLLGLAAGDALGTTLEFKPPGTFTPLEDLVGGGPFGLAPGQWTDDTSMALCLAESLIVQQGFDPIDQLERYLRWYRHGYLSSTGRCFDIGGTVRTALQRFERTHEPFCGSDDPNTAGNGSIMRLAPVAMAFASRPAEAITRCADSSRTTHSADAAVDACRYMGSLLVGALNGASKEELLSEYYAPLPGYWDRHNLHPGIAEIAAGCYKRKQPPLIVGDGYAVRSLEAALWAFYHSDSFRKGAVLAVNLGDDADTTGAVYGQIAGAYYGASSIPAEWRQRLALRGKLESYAERLLQLDNRFAT
jgi:ADP-ribosylglycohydrolase